MLYYLVVLPANRLRDRFAPHHDPAAPERPCPECLSSIPVGARRCAFCTAVLPTVDEPASPGVPAPRDRGTAS